MSDEGPRGIPNVDWAVATVALPGEDESGDLHVVRALPGSVLIGVMDGLGHGPEAALAAATAAKVLEEHADKPINELFKRCHDALRKTRGVVMSLATIDAAAKKLTWLGVGNVEAVLFEPDSGTSWFTESALLVGGVVGYQMPPLRFSSVPIERGDVLIFATDGIERNFAEDLLLNNPPETIARDILKNHCKGNDDALVLVARYLGDE